jgi:hypothetical protein
MKLSIVVEIFDGFDMVLGFVGDKVITPQAIRAPASLKRK